MAQVDLKRKRNLIFGIANSNDLMKFETLKMEDWSGRI